MNLGQRRLAGLATVVRVAALTRLARGYGLLRAVAPLGVAALAGLTGRYGLLRALASLRGEYVVVGLVALERRLLGSLVARGRVLIRVLVERSDDSLELSRLVLWMEMRKLVHG